MGNAFHKDGGATVFCEAFPVVGYVASAAQGIAGNHEHAKRAAIKYTTSTMTADGALGGELLGGAAGAMAGAAALNAVGIGVEHRLSYCIRDPKVRAAVDSVKLARFIVDMGLSTAAGGMGYKAGAATASGRGCVQRVVDSEGASDTFAARVPEALIDQ